MPNQLSQRANLYTPSVPQLSGPALRTELERLDDLTAAQVETVLAYAAEDGRLLSVSTRRDLLAPGCLLFQTLELATGLAYEHKLEPNGRAWHLRRAQPPNPWTHRLPRPVG